MSDENALLRVGPAELSVPNRHLIGRGLALAHKTGVDRAGQLAVQNTRLHLEGTYVHPKLLQQGLYRRLASGKILTAIHLGGHEFIVITSAGAKLVNVAGGNTRWSFDCPCYSGAVSPSGRLIALCTPWGIVVRDCVSGCLDQIDCNCDLYSKAAIACNDRFVAFSDIVTLGDPGEVPRSRTGYITSDQTILSAPWIGYFDLWDRTKVALAPVEQLSQGYHRPFVVFSPDGEFFAIADDRYLTVGEVGTQDPIDASAEPDAITAVEFRPGGEQVALAARKAFAMWNFQVGDSKSFRFSPPGPDRHRDTVRSIKYSADGGHLAILGDEGLLRVKSTTLFPEDPKEPRWEPVVPRVGMAGIATLSRESSTVTGWSGTQLVEVGLIDGRQCTLFDDRETWAGSILALEFDMSGEHVFAVNQAGALRSWHVATGQARDYPLPQIPSIAIAALSSSLNEVAFVTEQGRIIKLSLDTCDILSDAQLTGIERLYAEGAALNRDLSWLASATAQGIGIWRTEDGQVFGTYAFDSTASGQPWKLIFSRCNHLLAFVEEIGRRGRVVVIETQPVPKRIFATEINWNELADVAFSEDERLLALTYVNELRILDLRSPRCRILECEQLDTPYINKVRFNRFGSILAVGGVECVALCNPKDGSVLADVTLLTLDVVSIAFSPDGQFFATGERDGTVRVWRMPEVAMRPVQLRLIEGC